MPCNNFFPFESKIAAAPKAPSMWNHKSSSLQKSDKMIQNVFKIEGNDLEAISKWWDIFYELYGSEGEDFERSKTIARTKTTKCPWKIEGKGLDDW